MTGLISGRGMRAEAARVPWLAGSVPLPAPGGRRCGIQRRDDSMTSSLSIDVFNSGYKPTPGGPGWDDSTPATWPASTSTLISGERDAVLVDALLTTSERQRLAAWVQGTGKRPHT